MYGCGRFRCRAKLRAQVNLINVRYALALQREPRLWFVVADDVFRTRFQKKCFEKWETLVEWRSVYAVRSR